MADKITSFKEFQRRVGTQNTTRTPEQGPYVPPFRPGTIRDKGTDIEVVEHDSSTPITKTIFTPKKPRIV